MRKRDVVVFGGVLAVVIATAVVLISAFGCHFNDKQDDCPGDWPAPNLTVIVAVQDVPAGRTMDSLIEDDLLKLIWVPLEGLPLETLVQGAATDVSQIRGKTATRPIGKYELIPLEYLR
jgi:Flp pilus assembly protein CpaB